tara:strand:+ start:28368 stop:30293 length:1926 start_codon:yes stop_codon:yes gene_type:complete
MAQLSDIIKTLNQNQESQEETTDAVNELSSLFRKKFLAEERGGLDRLERQRESGRGRGGGLGLGISTLNIPGLTTLNGFIALIGNIIKKIVATVAAVAAGAAALAAAFAGLRGWELPLLEKLKNIRLDLRRLIPGSVSKSITKAMLNLRASILRSFGINPKIPTEFDPETKKNMQIKMTPAKIISDVYNKLTTRILKSFGIGADGKLITVQGKDGKFKTNIIGRLTIQTRSFFRPFVNLGKGLTKFFTGPFFQTIKNTLGTGVGGILKMVNRILWPIGFLVSLYDGVTAYIKSDADGFIAKLGVGIGAFFGSFIGAPFDLMKKGISWIIKKFFNVEVDKDGNALPGQGLAGWAVTALNSFSFEKIINGVISGLYQFVQDGVDFVIDFFTDPAFRKEQLAKLTALVTGPEGIIQKTKDFFKNIFDFLPSAQGIKDALYNLLPDWMRTDADEIREKLRAQTNRRQNQENILRQAYGIPQGGEIDFSSFDVSKILGNGMFGDSGYRKSEVRLAIGRQANAAKQMEDLAQELKELTGLNLGGKTSSRISKKVGSLVRIHPNELVVPLEKTGEGRALKKLDKILNASNAELQMAQAQNNNYSTTNMAPIIINNVDNSNVNNSQSDRRTYVATGGATDGFNLNQTVQ